MAEPSALLLDMDGTLVHTADANFAAYAAALKAAGIRVTRDAFDRVASGRHWRQFLPDLLGGTTAEAAAIAAHKRAIYPAMVARTHVAPAILALAMGVRGRMPIGLVTTASGPSVDAVLTHHALHALFDIVVTGDDVAESKPSPEPYLLAARRLGVAPHACLAIEDTDAGVESARRAGMTVLRV